MSFWNIKETRMSHGFRSAKLKDEVSVDQEMEGWNKKAKDQILIFFVAPNVKMFISNVSGNVREASMYFMKETRIQG